MKSSFIILLTLAALIRCDNDHSYDKNNNKSTEEEKRILEFAYSKDSLYPNGFYRDTTSKGSVYYENTVSTKPLSERKDIWIELSTNDKNEAFLWSKYSNDYSSDIRTYISDRETEKYFEFKWQNGMYNNDILLSRVHKTSFFQPKLDRFKKPDTVGVYNGEVNVNSVREFIEYLWSSGTYGLPYSKVLTSQIMESDDYYEQFIQSILIVYGDRGINDEIEVYNNYFRLSKTNRTLILESNKIKTIEVTLVK